MDESFNIIFDLFKNIGVLGGIISFCGLLVSLCFKRIRPINKKMTFTLISSMTLFMIGGLNYQINEIYKEQKQEVVNKVVKNSEHHFNKDQQSLK